MNTEEHLSVITDEGLFERLATAVLREANPIYSSLIHTGVNAAGKTVKSALDGICFVEGSNPPHMIAVHHTTTSRENLSDKWLHDPSRRKNRNGKKPIAPPGDLLKTAHLVREERKRTPNLQATLVLTTNQEPSEALVRDVEVAGHDQDLEIDLWTRSRLSHFLDNKPTGQWIRYSLLGIDQEQLSPELLLELSKRSLEIHVPPDNPKSWIPRSLDSTLKSSLRRNVTFLVAGSGQGKSVACYRELAAHVEGGAFGLVLPHEVIDAAVNLEQAITARLRQLHPPLGVLGMAPLSFSSPQHPFLLVVEDINRSGRPHHLVEKIAGWGKEDNKNSRSCWRLICPLWPEVLAHISDQARKRVEPLTLSFGSFSENEGRDAILARAVIDGRELTSASAITVSRDLGNDPLLIALYDPGMTTNPHLVINQFVDGCLARSASALKDHPAADYRESLRALAEGMLANRQMNLTWNEINGWTDLNGNDLLLLSRLAHQGDLIRLSGPSDSQRLSFRHDRVRDWILVDAIAKLDRRNLLSQQIIEEPYFARVFGAVLAWKEPSPSLLQRVTHSNPLSLFFAFRLLGPDDSLLKQSIVQRIHTWLDNPTNHGGSNLCLRLEALAELSESDSEEVPAIIRRFRDKTRSGQIGRLRNGDITGGVEFCMSLEPGVGSPWRDTQIEHAKRRFGKVLTKDLDDFLRMTDLATHHRIGALRLAGHMADPQLAPAIESCWNVDPDRDDHLAEYLWAFSECCGDNPSRFLTPVCDAWAELSDQPEKEGSLSQREKVGADHLRWAFQKWPPAGAIEYFIQRGSRDDLKEQVIHLLHGVDHPKAVHFLTNELAAIRCRLDGSKSFSPFSMFARDEWERAQENGRPMSKVSRDLLREIWTQDANDKYLRIQALLFWAATRMHDDIAVLSAAQPSDDLASIILGERLKRGDEGAIPEMVTMLANDINGYWWQYGRHLWSPLLTEILDDHLRRRREEKEWTWGKSYKTDWITYELIMRLTTEGAERLLLKHWDHLRVGSPFVQAALYVATPPLLEAARSSINECPEPSSLLQFLGQHFGILMKGHPGITRESQVLALVPYLHLLSEVDIWELWESCNDHGWFITRREHLDRRLQPSFLHRLWDPDQVFAQLDRMIANDRIAWIDHWVGEFLKTGVLWTELITTMTAWLDRRRSIGALRVVATAIRHFGTRTDLEALKAYEGVNEKNAEEVIADTRFAVHRRSIR